MWIRALRNFAALSFGLIFSLVFSLSVILGIEALMHHHFNRISFHPQLNFQKADFNLLLASAVFLLLPLTLSVLNKRVKAKIGNITLGLILLIALVMAWLNLEVLPLSFNLRLGWLVSLLLYLLLTILTLPTQKTQVSLLAKTLIYSLIFGVFLGLVLVAYLSLWTFYF